MYSWSLPQYPQATDRAEKFETIEQAERGLQQYDQNYVMALWNDDLGTISALYFHGLAYTLRTSMQQQKQSEKRLVELLQLNDGYAAKVDQQRKEIDTLNVALRLANDVNSRMVTSQAIASGLLQREIDHQADLIVHLKAALYDREHEEDDQNG